jgi:hypothetical protein
VAVSTTVRPVTQTAEVAVKMAVRNGATCPSALENGSMRRAVPVRTVAMKAMGMIRSG